MKSRIFALIFLLSACDMPVDDAMRSGVDASSQMNLRANVITPHTEAATVVFDRKSVELDAKKSPSLSFLSGSGVQQVMLFTPANDALSEPRALAISRMIRAQGIASTRIVQEVLGSLPADTYRIEAKKLVVKGPPCPNWSQSATMNFYNKPFSQLGCSTVSNLGQMVDDPQDFTGNNALVAPDSARNVGVITSYKTGGAAAPTPAASAASDAAASAMDAAAGAASLGQ